MVQVSDSQREKFRKACWHVANYTPSAAQAAFHGDDSRLKLVAGGIRGGKSFSTAMDILPELLIENALVWIVGPDYEQCKPEWEYMHVVLQKLGLITKASSPERGGRSFETTWGARVQTKSSDDARSLASFAPHVILMVEAGQQTYETMQKVLERALEHNAKVIMSGTFEGALSWYADFLSVGKAKTPKWGAASAFHRGLTWQSSPVDGMTRRLRRWKLRCRTNCSWNGAVRSLISHLA
jgi:hypothetical protein